uniref:YZ1 protein n=1 Tax=Saccharum hybrid cultivar R570 TaxID=131158 RepID=A0A059Q180_9POAL|nr:YZ1 protein [Saccharum hybrid cultivar R570]
MAREAASKATAIRGSGAEAEAAAGEYWSEALKSFLDHIPVSSVPGALQPTASPAVEVKLDGSVLGALDAMYSSNAAGAVIVDVVQSSFGKYVDRDIGFVEFSSLVLWALEELGKVEGEPTDSTSDFLSSLKQHRQIAETKIAWLAKLSLWEPFFPVRTHDTLFHAMLLFSKHHRLNVAPVVESMNSSVIGFVTQNAVMELLLQSSGLEWLDKIADKQLSEFRFEYVRKPVLVYSDQTLADGLHILSKEKTGVAVIDRKTSCLIGSIQCSDLYLFLDDSSLFSKRTTTTLEELINLNNKADSKCSAAENSSAPAQNILALRNRQPSVAGLPATNLKSDTLKQAMEKLTASRSSCSFIIDEQGHVEGVVTTRDIISVFSPPSMDSRIDGGTFFSAALEQAGCRVENGQMIQNS